MFTVVVSREQERDMIADFIESNGLSEQMIMVSGDAHMIAATNGSSVRGSFPVFHASSMDARPSIKGGPYS